MGASARLRPIDVAAHAFDSVAETHCQHRLSRILEYVDHAPFGVFEKDVLAIGQQMNFGVGRSGLNETSAEFFCKKRMTLVPAAESTAAAEFADDCDLGEVFKGVKAAMAIASGNHDAAFIHPLQLTGGDAREFDHLVGIERDQHCLPIRRFGGGAKTFQKQNVSNIFNASCCVSS